MTLKEELLNLQLPETVDVRNIARLIEISAQIKATKGDIELDCSQVRFFDPFGMTILAALLESIEGNRRVTMVWLSINLSRYLERMDFFKRLHIEGVYLDPSRRRNDQTGNLLEITLLRDTDSSEEVADKLATAIVGNIIGRGPKPVNNDTNDQEYDQYYFPLRYALSELVENGLTHAKREGRRNSSVWIASQYYRNGREAGKVQIAVIDDGCGFLATLRNHPEIRDPSHTGAILVALKPKVSCNRDIGPFAESVNEGVGLTTTVSIAKASGGCVHIVSGNALVLENNDPSVKRKDRSVLLPAAWDGVAISVTFEREKLPFVRVADLLPQEEEIQKNNLPAAVTLRFED